MKNMIERANILCEALPYINKLAGKTVVVKYGGNAMQDEAVIDSIMQDIAMLKIVGVNPVLVHGGGPEINAMLERLDIKSEFHSGLRVTDSAAMDVVQMVMAGKINKNITARLNALGAKAIGLTGKDARLIRARKRPPLPDGTDLGYVGEVTGVNDRLLTMLCADEFIPVIAGIGEGEDGQSYNINADTVAAEIAAALKAEKLIYLTDIDGIRRDPQNPATLISVITAAEIERMIADGSICGGMIPKVEACVKAVDMGINRVHIVSGTVRHPILLEIFTDKGIGTMIVKE